MLLNCLARGTIGSAAPRGPAETSEDRLPWPKSRRSEASERPADTGLRGETPGHDLNDDQIRERAYLIWVDEGRPSGRELDHWLRAKWELGREPKQE